MNVVFTVTFTGIADADDIRTAKQTIYVENQRLAALPTPGTPLATATLADVKASYLSILTARVTADHINNIRLAKSSFVMMTRFTATEVDQINANLIDQLNAGVTSAAVIAKTV